MESIMDSQSEFPKEKFHQGSLNLNYFKFDTMMQETYEINKNLRHSNSKEFEGIDLSEFSANVAKGISSPGVVYWVDKNISTFCIRGRAVENLEDFFQKILNNPEILKSFDCLGFPPPNSDYPLRFLETMNLELAKNIVLQMMNKRFPNNEEMLYNINDPGHHWWMEDCGNSFQIFFRPQVVTDDKRTLIRLGPLGEAKEACSIFRESIPFLNSLIPIAEFFVSEKMMRLAIPGDVNPNFDFIKSLFARGISPDILIEFFKEIPEFPHTKYFEKLSLCRKFWTKVENDLS